MSRVFRHGHNPDYFAPGDYNVICDRTGFKVKASECEMEWNGLFVRKLSWEPRHPQDFIKGKVDDQTVAVSRSVGDDVFTVGNGPDADDL